MQISNSYFFPTLFAKNGEVGPNFIFLLFVGHGNEWVLGDHSEGFFTQIKFIFKCLQYAI